MTVWNIYLLMALLFWLFFRRRIGEFYKLRYANKHTCLVDGQFRVCTIECKQTRICNGNGPMATTSSHLIINKYIKLYN